jgi:hypothetical protein
MRPSQLLAAVVALSSVSAAWPDVFENVNALGEVKNALYGRQDNTESAEPTKTDPPKSSDEAKSSDAPKETGDPTPTPTGKDDNTKTTAKSSGTAKPGSKTTGKPKATNYGPDVPAGGIAMVTPAAISGPQYYKIGDWVTFAWNYTSLSETPAHVDVLATCTQNQQTYTIAVNQSTEETGMVLWNTSDYEQAKDNRPALLMASYTLLIYDSNSSPSATAKPGYLAPFSQFQFAMYQKQPYVAWDEFECANCVKNGALSATEALTLKVLVFTSATTIASLLYFAGSFGVW